MVSTEERERNERDDPERGGDGGDREERKPIVGLTMGDPGGIGPEVIVAAYPELTEHARIVAIGDRTVLERATELRGSDAGIRSVASAAEASDDPSAIRVLDLDNVDELVYGEVREAYGEASLEYVERAIELALENGIDAITTAPINKAAIRSAGAEHAGHTGLLAERTGVSEYSMLLIEGPLRVSHVSTHVPLREAISLVTTDRVAATIEVTDRALRDLGIDGPAIAVTGVNPHAGESGLLGNEDDDEIVPAVERVRERGIDATGPISPDTVFVRAAGGEFDCVVTMYHDQGHIPIKTLGFEESGAVSGVNMTIGLPIIRTSVDHGTAFDIAGEGVASPKSMVDAVRVASEAAREP